MKLGQREARGALAVIALVVVASVVGGREQPAGATSLSTTAQPNATASAAAEAGRSPTTEAGRSPTTAPHLTQKESLVDLDMAKLRRQNWSDGVANLLGPRVVPAPAPPPAYVVSHAGPAVAPPAPAPVAPPLPFAYLGKIIDGGKTTVFVGRGADHYFVARGTRIDQYQVESVTETQITFVYRPLGMRQVLVVPQPGEQSAVR